MPTPDLRQFNTLLPEFRADPYPLYRQTRERFPIFWSEAENAWVLTRHADALAVFGNPRFLNAELGRIVGRMADALGQDLPGLFALFDALPFLRNPPAHKPGRHFLARVLALRPLAAYEQEIAAIVQRLLAPLDRDGGMDLAIDYAERLPPLFMGGLFGLGESESLFLARTLSGVAATLDRGQPMRVYRQLNLRLMEAYELLREEFAQRRRVPRDDGLSLMLALGEAEYALGENQLAAHAVALFLVGFETTAALIGNGLNLLLAHPGQRQQIAAAPTLLDAAVEETARLEPPIQQTSRYASEACPLAGHEIEAGQRVLLLIGAANRDPAAYPEPDRFRLDRQGPPNLTFGSGRHACLGTQIAKLEAKLAYAGILDRPGLRVRGGPPEWWPCQSQRRLKSLPVALV